MNKPKQTANVHWSWMLQMRKRNDDWFELKRACKRGRFGVCVCVCVCNKQPCYAYGNNNIVLNQCEHEEASLSNMSNSKQPDDQKCLITECTRVTHLVAAAAAVAVGCVRSRIQQSHLEKMLLTCCVTRMNVVRLLSSRKAEAPTYVQVDRRPPRISTHQYAILRVTNNIQLVGLTDSLTR
jgi:hypothetical protein